MRGQQLLGVLVLVGATCSAGCFVRASARGEADAPVTYTSAPTLVAVGSGVWVVRGSAHAAYYVGDTYWVYRDSTWYRSSTWEGGWVVVEAKVVPSIIVDRDHTKYVMYQGEATAETRIAPKGDVVASAEPASKNPNGGPPGHDDTPGLGNQKKEAGLQPGTVGASANKNETPKAKDEPKVKETPKPKDEPKVKETPKPKEEPKAKEIPKPKEEPKAKEEPKPKEPPKPPPAKPEDKKDEKKK
jgi:hypothetical protein